MTFQKSSNKPVESSENPVNEIIEISDEDIEPSVSSESDYESGNLFYNNGKKINNDSALNIFKNELTHILAVTAHASKQTEKECLRLGMKELIPKPIS